MRAVGIEPTHPRILDFESSASTSSTTPALAAFIANWKQKYKSYAEALAVVGVGESVGGREGFGRRTLIADVSSVFLMCVA